MKSKVPHKSKGPLVSTRSATEKIMIVLSILIAISMVAGLFVGIF